MDDDMIIKRDLIDQILEASDGVVKSASAATSKVTRTTIREEGFQRSILPYEDVTADDLDYFGDSELPGIWFELEPDSPAARSIPYNASPNTALFRAEKYLVLFHIITTEEMTKNVRELRTYKTDVRQIVSDNVLRDIHTAEDAGFITEIDRIVGAQVALSSAPSKEVQNVGMGATITRETWKRAQSFLPDRRLPLGVTLVNQRTAREFLGWKRDEVGGDLAEQLYRLGLRALEKFEIFGSPIIATIKNDLVLNGYAYQFAPKDFLGHALRLQDIEVTIKKEYDIVRMRGNEEVGFTIGNTRGVQKLQFNIGN